MDLVFSRPRYIQGDPLDLVFGDTLTPDILPLTVQGSLYLGAPEASGTLLYDNRLPAVVSTSARARHQSAAPADAQPVAPWGQPEPASQGSRSAWQSAGKADAAPGSTWGRTDRAEAPARAPWQAAAPVSQRLGVIYQACTPLDVLTAIGWQLAAPVTVNLLSEHQVAEVLHQLRVVSAQQGAPASANALAPHQVAAPAQRAIRARWQVAAQLIPPGLTVLVPGGGTGITPHAVDLDLVFACPAYEAGAPVDLVFGHVCLPSVGPPATLSILPARYYMAVHSLTAARLPDNEAVAIFDVSLSADKGSFDWSFSARARREAIEQFEPVAGVRPAIQITLDGIAFVFTVDKIAESEAFGQRGVTISGRSVTALIGGQHARETSRLNASAANAQQLALDALAFSGVGLDWGIPDWLVPAGAWSHTGTPLAAVQNIVEAAGGYLQSHRTLPTLLARHPYPDLPGGMVGAPWHWESASFAADVALAPDALMVTGTEHVDGADINGVYVAGVSQGFRAWYKRGGTEGNLLAPMVSDPLIVAPEVARMRGRSIVGAAGRKHLVSIELPVLTGPSQPGVLDVGQLVQIDAAAPWRGMVRSVRASAKFGEKVRQTVQIERHLEQV